MIVFRYDKTFEGLLTAVFDAYARRQWPDVLLAAEGLNVGDGGRAGSARNTGGEMMPLFVTEEHTVVTDPEKSGRVWRGLSERLPREVCNMLFFGWLSEEPEVDMMLMRYMRRVFGRNADGDSSENRMVATKTDAPHASRRSSVATDFSDPDILRVKQLAQKVSKERERLMQFTRFQKGSDGEAPKNGDTSATDGAIYSEGTSADSAPTYFAPVSPRYNALPLAIPYFRDRFRDQRWLIYDIKRRYGFYYDLHTVTEVTMEDDAHLVAGKLDDAMLAEDEKLFQSLWKSYFNSMAIAERINPRLQRQHMPKRFWHLLTEMQ